jgi:hypothetical protein
VNHDNKLEHGPIALEANAPELETFTKWLTRVERWKKETSGTA